MAAKLLVECRSYELVFMKLLALEQGFWGDEKHLSAGKRVTTPADNKSIVQQAKDSLAAAAAVTVDKASQAYQ